jgi:radical SAM protein with 4Fe4S-binding SPASM domain
MTIELRPLGVKCNLACRYCYQNPQRDAKNQRMSYDLEKMKAAAKRSGNAFTLFGGEPLLMRFDDLEHLFAWGFETFGSSTIQSNGLLIESKHIELFRRYNVSVGISIDGPNALNDARWSRSLKKTRQSTTTIEAVIARLCHEYQAPGLIVTLHKGNATGDKLLLMFEWIRKLDAMGIKSVRLHLLEVDHPSVRDSLALSPKANIEALLAFANFEQSLVSLRFDLFREMENLLDGKDGQVGCTWRACDPYTTDAVQGVEGNGETSNCGRTNKEGINFTKADKAGYERYLALSRTPQSENGCSGCRFFLMCKGQCPGTAVDGDWRNRTEHCQEWMNLFSTIEQRMVLAGKVPLTIKPLRFELERLQIESWKKGKNPSISKLSWDLQKSRETHNSDAAAKLSHDISPASPIHTKIKARISWVSSAARESWLPKLNSFQVMLEDMTVYSALANNQRCSVRRVPAASLHRLIGMAAKQGLGAAIFPVEALSGGICTKPCEGREGVFLAGTPARVAEAQKAYADKNESKFKALINLPTCCCHQNPTRSVSKNGKIIIAVQEQTAVHLPKTVYLPKTMTVHPLLAPLGISVLPVFPCRLQCQSALDSAERWLELAVTCGYANEVSWLRDCFSWAIDWSEQHGITEIKTPIFKLCTPSQSHYHLNHIIRDGTSTVEGGAAGLSFPYAPRTCKVSGAAPAAHTPT